MKNFKRLFYGSLLLSVMLLMMSVNVFAARTIPKKVRVYTGSVDEFSFKLEPGEYFKIASAKGLKYKITDMDWSTSSTSTESTGAISVYAAKSGKYTMKVDIYKAATDKKAASATITIFAQSDSPFKTVLINGKDRSQYNHYLTKDKAVTIKVTMNKGYTLKKLEYGVYGKPTVKNDSSTSKTSSNDMIYKTFKNGSKITLGTYGYYYLNQYSYEDTYNNGANSYKNQYLSGSLTAPTQIKVTYIDKYTKEEDTTYLGSFSKLTN